MDQIHKEAFKFSLNTPVKTCVLYGGTSVGHQLRKVEEGAHLVVGTPGRLLDVIRRGKVRGHVEYPCLSTLEQAPNVFGG